jgi:hypothetical protein
VEINQLERIAGGAEFPAGTVLLDDHKINLLHGGQLSLLFRFQGNMDSAKSMGRLRAGEAPVQKSLAEFGHDLTFRPQPILPGVRQPHFPGEPAPARLLFERSLCAKMPLPRQHPCRRQMGINHLDGCRDAATAPFGRAESNSGTFPGRPI